MSRPRSNGGLGGGETKFNPTTGLPTTSAPSGTVSFNIYNDAFMQLDRPTGKNWVQIQSGLQRGIYVHNNMIPSVVARPVVVSINGTALVDQASATNIPNDPNDTIALANYTTSGASAALARITTGIGEDSNARFSACFVNIGRPFRIVKMGVYCVDGTNCTALRGKFGIYQAANHYSDNAMPWKIYPKATLSINQSNPATNTKYTFSWDVTSQPPVIEAEKFYVKCYWNNTGTGNGPYLLARYSLDMATGFKGDRFRAFDVSENYSTPDWTTAYDYTAGVGNQDGTLGRGSTLFWFIVEPL